VETILASTTRHYQLDGMLEERESREAERLAPEADQQAVEALVTAQSSVFPREAESPEGAVPLDERRVHPSTYFVNASVWGVDFGAHDTGRGNLDG